MEKTRLSRKLQKNYKTNPRLISYQTAVRWIKNLLGRPDAHSKAGARVEQLEWTRHTSSSVEITIQTDEVFVYRATPAAPDLVVAAATRLTGENDRGI